MEQKSAYIPQELIDVFTDNGLALPPLPSVALRFLQPVSEYAFSTHPEWEPVAGRHVVFSAPAPSDAPSEEARFYCGIDGYGVQNWTFRYVLEVPALGIGLVLPYGSVFGNPEAEAKRIEQVYDLILGCFAATRGGTSFGSSTEARLEMKMDADGFHFIVIDKQGSVIQEGTTVSAFVDLLTIWGAEAGGNSPQDWTRV